jgi:hypothetical protein
MNLRLTRLTSIVLLAAVLAHVSPPPVLAQVAVIDPINIARAVITATQLAAVYEQQQRLYAIWDEYRQALAAGKKLQYLTSDVPWRAHLPIDDPLHVYQGLMNALDHGDLRGAAYDTAVGGVPSYPTGILSPLSNDERQRVTSTMGAMMATDGWARLAIATLGQGHGSGLESSRALDALQRDFASDAREDNGSIAILQQIAGADLLMSRDNQIANQTLSSLLEAAVVRHLRLRDAVASELTVDIERRQHYLAVAGVANQDTSRLIQNWRLP